MEVSGPGLLAIRADGHARRSPLFPALADEPTATRPNRNRRDGAPSTFLHPITERSVEALELVLEPGELVQSVVAVL